MIEIPDLDDLVFERDCNYCEDGLKDEYIEIPKAEHKRGGPTYKRSGNRIPCSWCKGTRIIVTKVGERLIEFLKLRGVELFPRKKD